MHKQTPRIGRLATFGIAGIAITTISLQPKVSEAKSDRFFCQSAIVRGKTVPVTYAATKSLGNVPMIAWVRNDFATSVSPQQRCQAVARRFQAYYENRTLKYMRTGTVNSYPVICIADRKGNACDRDRIVVTLKRGTNANQVLSQLLDVRGRSNGRLVYLNGNQIFSYAEGETYFDMEQFLEEAP